MRAEMLTKLPIHITKKKKWFVAACPALDLVTQGPTKEEAERNIAEVISLFLDSCSERGTLEAVLKQSGIQSSEPGN